MYLLYISGLSNSIDLLRDLTGQTSADSSSSSGGGSSDVLHRARVYQTESVASRPVMDIQVWCTTELSIMSLSVYNIYLFMNHNILNVIR